MPAADGSGTILEGVSWSTIDSPCRLLYVAFLCSSVNQVDLSRLSICVAKETVSNTKGKEELIVYRRLQVPVTNFTLLLMSVCCRQVI